MNDSQIEGITAHEEVEKDVEPSNMTSPKRPMSSQQETTEKQNIPLDNQDAERGKRSHHESKPTLSNIDMSAQG